MVSVIMPVYNGEKFLSEAIESVLAQTFSDFELIIINDGSKDNSLNIIKECAKKDSRIKVIDQENKGVSSARNTGINQSEGQFVAFLDCDDVWEKEKLESQISEFNKNEKIKICGTWGIVINKNGEKIKDFNYPPLSNKKIKLSSVYKYPFITSSLVIEKKMLNLNNLFDEKIKLAEDYDFIIKYLYQHQAININTPLIKYRIHDNNSDSSISKKIKFKFSAVVMRLKALCFAFKYIFKKQNKKTIASNQIY